MGNLKTILLQGTIVSATLFGFGACNPKPDDTKKLAEQENKAVIDDKDEKKDAQFLVDAAEINLEEIRLGQLAQQRGLAADVKELGKMMEDAHSRAQADLVALAGRKMINVPTTATEKGKDAYDKLSGKSGNDFDKEYCDMMVKGHKDAIDRFERESNNGEDPDIKNWAAAMLAPLHEHLDHANACQNKLEAMK
jgi:putative membrane protein